MHPPVRFQDDIVNQKEWSDAAGIDFTDTDIIVRPEFQAETKIETILRNHGIDPMNQRHAEWGKEIDERIDLQTALYAVREAQNIYPHVPQELRGEFPNWQAVLNGVENGSYQYALMKLEEQKEETKKRQEQLKAERAEFDTWRASNKKAPEPAPPPSSDTE